MQEWAKGAGKGLSCDAAGSLSQRCREGCAGRGDRFQRLGSRHCSVSPSGVPGASPPRRLLGKGRRIVEAVGFGLHEGGGPHGDSVQ